MAKQKFYGYIIENIGESGVLTSWEECKNKVKGKKARYKGFLTKVEAESWLKEGGVYKKKLNKFYGCYFVHSNTGIVVNSWGECKSLIAGGDIRYKSFKKKLEAQNWIDSGGSYEKKDVAQKKLPKGIYFDAGTGRGIGTEVRVTDKDGTSILYKFVPQDKINKYGNYLTKKGSTNNFGELLGCYIALNIALNEGIKVIFGDSKLVIDYWSKGRIKAGNVNAETLKLSEKVKKLRVKFEKLGGKICHISGDINPSDLGFHK